MLRTQNLPNELRSLSWFFPSVNSYEMAESILLHKAQKGQYLLRRSTSSPGNYTISIRTENDVKHYPVEVNGDCIRFGLATFYTFPEFLNHFKQQPFISESSDQLLKLTNPFIQPKYQTILETPYIHGFFGKDEQNCEKCGFLTKQGGFIKTWKERWFILNSNYLSYFEKMNSEVPKNTIDMRDCTAVRRFLLPNTIPGKEFAFELKTPWRDYLMLSAHEEDRDSWAETLNQTIKKFSQRSIRIL